MIFMRNEDNKKLSCNSKAKYEECLAKLVLEDVFPERYRSLVLADKPDIQGENVGIEVTYAVDEKDREAFGNWVKALHSSDPVKKRHHVERMSQLGVEFTGGIQGWSGRVPTFRYIRASTEKKVNLINKGGYAHFKYYELFIFADMWITENVLIEAKQFFFAEAVSVQFRTIYVLAEGTELHVFDTHNKMHTCIILESEEQEKRSISANLMIKK